MVGDYLSRQDYESHAYHDDHVKLRWPDIRHEVAVSYRGKRDYNIISGLEEVEVSMSRPLKVLNTADAATSIPKLITL